MRHSRTRWLMEKIQECSANYISQNINDARNELNKGNFNEALSISEKVIQFDNANIDAQKIKEECRLTIEAKALAEENARKLAESKRLEEEQANKEAANKALQSAPSNTPTKSSGSTTNKPQTINDLGYIPKSISQDYYERQNKQNIRTFDNITISSSVKRERSPNPYFTSFISISGISSSEKIPYKMTFDFPFNTLILNGITSVNGDSKTIPVVDSNVVVDFEVTYNGKTYKFTEYPTYR